MDFVKEHLIHYSRTQILLIAIATGILAYLIPLLYEGYESRAHIRRLRSRGIVSSLNDNQMPCLTDSAIVGHCGTVLSDFWTHWSSE